MRSRWLEAWIYCGIGFLFTSILTYLDDGRYDSPRADMFFFGSGLLLLAIGMALTRNEIKNGIDNPSLTYFRNGFLRFRGEAIIALVPAGAFLGIAVTNFLQ